MSTEQKTDQNTLYEQASKLPSDEWLPFLHEHGLTGDGYWRWQQRNKTRPTKRSARAGILARQKGCCALCGERIIYQACLDRSGQMICRRCNLYMATWRKARAAGVTEDQTRILNGDKPEQPVTDSPNNQVSKQHTPDIK